MKVALLEWVVVVPILLNPVQTLTLKTTTTTTTATTTKSTSSPLCQRHCAEPLRATPFRHPQDTQDVSRRNILQSITAFAVAGSVATLFAPSGKDAYFLAHAANLPSSTGADLSKCGTLEALVPIVRIRETLQKAQMKVSSTSNAFLPKNVIQQIYSSLALIPSDETGFKRIFDEYSDPVSYKQKFLDQNAFLVYYTGGFDGPGRPNIESGEVPKQTLQYGFRNDAWGAYEEFLAELSYARKETAEDEAREDLQDPLDRTLKALDAYLSLAAPSDVQKATVQTTSK